jgi:hypothetical protein
MAEVIGKEHRIYRYLIILVIVAAINTLLARFATVVWSSAPGASDLYFAIAFMIPFTLWFGAWGAIAAYAGCIIGAGLGTMPFSVNLYWSLADLWQVLIPLIAFKLFHADVSLKSKRDFFIFLVFGCLLNSLVGASWGSTMLSAGGVSGWSDALYTLVTWFTGNLIVTLVITTLLLKYVTRYVVNQGLFVKKYWF